MSGHEVMMMKRDSGSRSVRMPTQDEIAERAYELFLMRGASHGADVEDWLRAERELQDHNN
jgi:Protein of unknown function (DUF2934)